MLSAGRSLVQGIGKGSQAARTVRQSAHDAVYRGNGCDQQQNYKNSRDDNPVCQSASKRWKLISGRRWRNLTGHWKGLRGWFKSELNIRLRVGNDSLRAYFRQKGYEYTSVGGTNLFVPSVMIRRSIIGRTLRLSRRQLKALRAQNAEIRKALWNRLVYKNRRPKGLKIPATKSPRSRVKLRPPPLRPGSSRIRPIPMPRRRLPSITPPTLRPIVIGRRRPSAPPSRPARPVTPSRPIVSSGDKQIARQNALVASVRRVYGSSTSASAAKVVLKTQSWSTLKQLGIVKHIMRAFKGLGYRRAGRSERVARRLVKKTVRNWKQSPGTTPQAPARPVSRPTPRPSPRPAPAPRTRPAAPTITKAQRKIYVTAALLVALKKKGLATTTAEAVAFAKGQSWSTVLALKIHVEFVAALNNDARLGKWRPAVMNKRHQTRIAKVLYLSLK